MRHRLWAVLLAAVAAVVVASCGGDSSGSPAGISVSNSSTWQ